MVADEVKIKFGDQVVTGILGLPKKIYGIVVFAHGSGSGRFSPKNLFVAKVLHRHEFGTLLIDLLSKEVTGL